jgi:hypothetical protein
MRSIAGVVIVALVGLVGGTGVRAEDPPKPQQETETLVAPMDLMSLARVNSVTLTGSEAKEASPALLAADGKADTAFEARQVGSAHVDVIFRRPQRLVNLGLMLGEGAYTWSVTAADTREDLEKGGPSARVLVAPRARNPVESWERVEWPAAPVGALRIQVEPRNAAGSVVVREIAIGAEQRLSSLQVKAPRDWVARGDFLPLQVYGEFSGGALRKLERKEIRFVLAPKALGRMGQHQRLYGLRFGHLQVAAVYGKLVSPAFTVEVVEGGD